MAMNRKTFFDTAFINHGLGLSCIENYFLYAIESHVKDFHFLFCDSYLNWDQIWDEIFEKGVNYAHWSATPRLHHTAKKHGIADFNWRRMVTLELSGLAYNAVSINPKYIRDKYKTAPWRDNHYLLVDKMSEDEYRYINDVPPAMDMITTKQLNDVFNGEIFGFEFTNVITNHMKAEWTAALIKELANNTTTEINADYLIKENALKIRDFIGILKVLRKRILAFASPTIQKNGQAYIQHLDHSYMILEYMKAKGVFDPLKVFKMMEDIQSEDHDFIDMLRRDLAKNEYTKEDFGDHSGIYV